MPYSTKGPSDSRRVFDAAGSLVPDVVEAQTSAVTGPTYIQLIRRPDGRLARGMLGGLLTRTVRANITIR